MAAALGNLWRLSWPLLPEAKQQEILRSLLPALVGALEDLGIREKGLKRLATSHHLR